MKIKILPMFALLLLALPALAGDPVVPTGDPVVPGAPGSPKKLSPAEATSLAQVNKLLADVTATQTKAQQCFDLEGGLKSELTRKKAEIAAEYKGKTPTEFADFFALKQARLERQHKACVAQYEALGQEHENLMLWFRGYEPKSLNVKKQKAQFDELKEKYLDMQPTAKPRVKKKPKAQD